MPQPTASKMIGILQTVIIVRIKGVVVVGYITGVPAPAPTLCVSALYGNNEHSVKKKKFNMKHIHSAPHQS